MSKLVVLLVSVFLSVASFGTAEDKWQQKKFIITMWCPPPATEENIQILARDKYTLTGVGIEGDRSLPESNLAEQLDLVHKHRMKALVFNPLLHWSSLADPAKQAQLDALIDSVKNHPGLDGYHITDEPSAVTFDQWAKLCKYIRRRDPEHQTYINLFPTYANQQQLGVGLKEVSTGPLGYPDNFAGIGANNQTVEFYNEHLNAYVEKISPAIISYDHYHFLKNGVDGQQYFLNLALIRNASIKTGAPFLNIVQACTIEPAWRLVNKEEMRWLAFTTMAYGGRGLSWFLYWGPANYGGMYQAGKRMPLADFGAEINQDITALGPELLKLESADVYQTAPLPVGTVAFPKTSPVQIAEGDFILGLFKEKETPNAFMVVNRDYKNEATAELTLNFGNGQLWIFSKTESKWSKLQAVENGTVISVPLKAGDGQLYKISQ